MENETRLGIPDDERAAAPHKRFRLGEKQVHLIARLLGPVTLLAWGAFAGKLVSEDLIERSQEAKNGDTDRPVKDEERGPSYDAPSQFQHEAPAKHQSPPMSVHHNGGGAVATPDAPVYGGAQVVQLQNLRAWRSPDAVPVDPDRFTPSRANTSMDYEAMRPKLPSTPRSAAVVDPGNDAPLVFPPTPTLPDDVPVETVPDVPSSPATPRAANSKPAVTGPVALGRGFRDESIILTAVALLAGAVDADGDTLAISNLTCTGGSIVSRGAGVWLFMPDQEFIGPAEFHYSITDGTDAITQTARLDLLVTPGLQIDGTAGDDVLVGTPRADAISGNDGDDIIYSREGDDVVAGGNGDDRIIGGDGNDILHGGDGNDLIFGGAGNDNIFGDAGNDTIDAGDGNDFVDGGDGNDDIDGGAGHDLIFGGADNDNIFGAAGNDTIDGGDGNDNLMGGDGADFIIGGAGNDVIDAGAGSDIVDAGEGDDQIIVNVFDQIDHIDGGQGSDTIDLSAIDFGIVVNLASGSVSEAGSSDSAMTIDSIENVIAGSGDDTIVADAKVNVLVGGAGDDSFVFPDIESLHNGGAGNDVIDDFQTGDRIDLSQINDQLYAYAAVKFFYDGEGHDRTIIGAVWYTFDDSDSGSRTIISGHVKLSDDHDDDDFSITLNGHQSITENNFDFEHHTFGA
ncbi:MAG: cadherin-like domain-containing protein [Cypionkella sp.]